MIKIYTNKNKSKSEDLRCQNYLLLEMDLTRHMD